MYVNTGTGLTKKVRSVRGEMEMEERGEREEGPDDIYMIPDDQDPVYETPDNVDPGTQNNSAQEQHGGNITTDTVYKG